MHDTQKFLREFGARLLAITKGCRVDMHEPDEQDLVARVVGDHLDNACGEEINAGAVASGRQEFVVILERDRHVQDRFNLATLIALARVGAEALEKEGENLC